MNGSIKLLSRKEYPWMYDNEHDNYSYGFFVKNKLVGRLRITHIKDEDLCSISEFLIDESYRGKGIGKQLLNRSRKPLASDMGMKAASSRPSCII